MASRITAVDLFCGLGGLTHGLESSGVDVVAGLDVDPACGHAYGSNNKADFLLRDVAEVTSSDVHMLLNGGHGRTLVAGCAPCQPFSTYSQAGRKARSSDQWNLVAAFGALVADVRPDYVTMENVPQLADHRVFQTFLDHLCDYHVWWSVVDCRAYAVPQTRKRLVLIASQHGEPEPLVASGLTPKTVRSAIGSLPALKAGEVDADDRIHRSSALSDINLRRVKASKPGGTWRDWPDELRARCHLRSSGATYPSVYGRMEWDQPAPTITTQCFGYGNGRFGHPEQDRAISLREAAMLQTFPRDYDFVGPGKRVTFSELGRLIGNAVPVALAAAIGQALVEHDRKMFERVAV